MQEAWGKVLELTEVLETKAFVSSAVNYTFRPVEWIIILKEKTAFTFPPKNLCNKRFSHVCGEVKKWLQMGLTYVMSVRYKTCAERNIFQ